MNDLFELPESKSPRLLWMERHEITAIKYSTSRCYAYGGHESAWGDTEDEAVTQLAMRLGIRLWSEEGMA